MVSDTQVLDKLFSEAQHLAPEYRLRLAQRILQTLVSYRPLQAPQPLRFGEFGGSDAAMSTLEDFAAVEWRPEGRSHHSS